MRPKWMRPKWMCSKWMCSGWMRFGWMRPNGATSPQPEAERSGAPGIIHRQSPRPKRAKALKHMEYKNRKHLIINAFALLERMYAIVLFPGCRYALPRAMGSLSFQDATVTMQDAFCPNKVCLSYVRTIM